MQINLMIPWMRDQIAEAWHNRKSSRAADKRSLALSSVSTGNPASNNTMLTPLPTSPENFSINVIRFEFKFDMIVKNFKKLFCQVLNHQIFLYSMEGNVLDVTVKPNFTVENIKKIAVIHFYGQDTTKPISRYRLVHSSKFRQLVDENYVDDEDINEYGIIIYVKLQICNII